MIYEIIIETYERQYKERSYGVVRTIDRATEIVECDNVIAIEVIDTQTGAIMLEVVDRKVVWLDKDFIKNMVDDIYSRI